MLTIRQLMHRVADRGKCVGIRNVILSWRPFQEQNAESDNLAALVRKLLVFLGFPSLLMQCEDVCLGEGQNLAHHGLLLGHRQDRVDLCLARFNYAEPVRRCLLR